MKLFRAGVVLAAAAWMVAPAAFGQRMFGGGPRDFGAAQMAKIFGKNQAFSATADTSVIDAQHNTPVQMQMTYAFLKGNLRTEIDMSTMTGSKMPPQAAAQMKQMGMDRIVNIYQSDKKVMYMVYPGLQSYCVMTPPEAPPSDKAGEKAKVDVTELGKETVDGHACVKNKVVITTDDGSQHETLTWNATDLNDFPIKTEMQAGGGTVTTHFHDIKLSAPSVSFEPPSDYKQYGSMQEMMMANMAHMMPPGGGRPGGPPSQ